jgi:hypothetical protein
MQSLLAAATAASPFRVVAGCAPDWNTRVVREADLDAASSGEYAFENYRNIVN